jgi:hypothetical protein
MPRPWEQQADVRAIEPLPHPIECRRDRQGRPNTRGLVARRGKPNTAGAPTPTSRSPFIRSSHHCRARRCSGRPAKLAERSKLTSGTITTILIACGPTSADARCRPARRPAR